jgi:hypothetical protein
MMREEAIAIAKDVARQNRWTWTGEIRATLHKPIPVLGIILRQRAYWKVVSNADDVGYNVVVTVDDQTRRVLSQNFGSKR